MSDEDMQTIDIKARCKCCLDNLGSKNMWEEYFNDDEREVYGEMLMECFALTWDVSEEEYICESCIYRLRDAVKLKIEFLAVQELLQENLLENGKVISLKVEDETEINLTEEYEEEHLEDELEEFTDDMQQDETISEQPPRKYPKKKKRHGLNKIYKTYTKQDMETAVAAVKVHGMRIGEASRTYGIPRRTLTVKSMAEEKDDTKDTTQEKHMKLVEEIRMVLKYTNALPFKTKTTKYYCAYCSTDGPFFEDPEILRAHTKSEHGEHMIRHVEHIMRPAGMNEILKIDITDLQCTLCYIRLENWNSMFIHFAEVHDVEFDEAYTRLIPYSLVSELKCVLCNEGFLNFGHLDVHMNLHFCNYICYECGDTFLASSRLDRHLKVHKVGNYPCELCDKVFSLELYRSKHISMVHNHESSVKCLYCTEKFPSPILRHQHVSKVHPEKIKIFTCELCGKSYTWKPYFLNHKKRMHGEKSKKYECEHCGKIFMKAYELRNHMVEHSDKKNFTCGMCGMGFKNILDLNTHWKAHDEFYNIL